MGTVLTLLDASLFYNVALTTDVIYLQNEYYRMTENKDDMTFFDAIPCR